MRTAPASSTYTWLYEQSRLKMLANAPDFDRLRSRVRQFNRDSLVAMGARIMWFLWQDQKRLSKEEQAYITWSHALGIMGMACIYAPLRGRNDASEADFRVLARELFMCPTGTSAVRDQEANDMLAARLTDMQSRTDRDLLRRIPVTEIRTAHVSSLLAQLARSQVNGHLVSAPSRMVRPVLIYELMHTEARKRGLESALQRAEVVTLRTDYLNYVRGLIVLRALAVESAKHSDRPELCPGVVRLVREGALAVNQWAPTRWEDVLVTAERLAIPMSYPQSF